LTFANNISTFSEVGAFLYLNHQNEINDHFGNDEEGGKDFELIEAKSLVHPVKHKRCSMSNHSILHEQELVSIDKFGTLSTLRARAINLIEFVLASSEQNKTSYKH
jgi:hypothetical protein